MPTRFVPSERVLPLFYPALNLGTTIVNRYHLSRFKVRIGHNKSDTREELTDMPFYFTNNPSEFIPTFSLVMELDDPHLYPALWGTTDVVLQVGLDVLFEAAVAGNPNEVGDPLLFAKRLQVRTGKCRIAMEPELLEPRPVAVNQRRDKVQDAIG